MNSLRRSLWFVVAAVALFAAMVSAHAIESGDVWINEYGSSLTIEGITTDGQIYGHYINCAPCTRCRATEYPVTGWVLFGTNTITFTVKWDNPYENCHSLTAWTGFYDSTCDQIHTCWQLVLNGTKSVHEIRQGLDTFRRGSKTESARIESLP